MMAFSTLSVFWNLWSVCAVWVQQMGEMKEVKEKEKVDKQKEMEAVSVTQASTRQQSGLCASPWPQFNYLLCVYISDTDFYFHSWPLYLYNHTNTLNRLSLNWKYTMPVHALKTLLKNKCYVLQKFIVDWEHHQISFLSLRLSFWEIRD